MTLAGGITVLGNVVVPPIQLFTTHLLNEQLSSFSSETQWLASLGILTTAVIAHNILMGYTLVEKNCSSDPVANGLYFKTNDVLKVLLISTGAAYLSSFANLADLSVFGKSIVDGDGGKLIAEGLAAKSAVGFLYWGAFNTLIMLGKADKVVENLQPVIDFIQSVTEKVKSKIPMKGINTMMGGVKNIFSFGNIPTIAPDTVVSKVLLPNIR